MIGRTTFSHLLSITLAVLFLGAAGLVSPSQAQETGAEHLESPDELPERLRHRLNEMPPEQRRRMRRLQRTRFRDASGSPHEPKLEPTSANIFTRAGAELTGVTNTSSDVGDVNNDGNLDLVVTGRDVNFNASTTVYLGDGQGSFSAANAGLLGIRGGSSSFGDVNGDGNLDIVVAGPDQNNNPSARLYLGDGQGNFSAANAGLTGVTNSSTSFGDVDNDGNLDLVITGADASNSATAMLYLGDGQGGFTVANAGLDGVKGFGSESTASTFGDVDGDGNLDLVITGGDENLSPTATLYLGDSQGGFSVANAGLTGVGDGSSASFGDVDSNGNLDLLLTGSGMATLYLGDGQGGFTAANAGLTGVTKSSSSIGDLNGDGNPDLLITGDTNGFSDGGQSARQYIGDGQGGFSGATAGITGVTSGSSAFGDIDNDGDTDFVVAGTDSLFGKSARVYVNRTVQQSPNFSPQFVAGPQGQQSVAPGLTFFRFIEAGDPDGDALTLDITQGGSVSNVSFTDRGNGVAEFTFEPSRAQAGQNVTFTVEVSDGNGATATRTFSIDVGNEFFALEAGLKDLGSGSSSFGDVDNDGNLDLVLTGNNSNGRSASLYLGDGQGGFTNANAGITGVNASSSSSGDVDNDGNLDLLVTGRGSGSDPSATLYLGDGQGGFSVANAGLTGVEDGSSSIGDVDNDGNLDLLITGEDANNAETTILYLGDGQGGFTEASAGLTGVSNSASSMGDVNNDGNLDLVITGFDGSQDVSILYLGDGQGGFTEASAGLDAFSRGPSLSIGDVDNDNNLDLIFTGSDIGGPAVAVYLGDGQGGFTEVGADLSGVNSSSSALGDVNGDGNLDLLVTGRDDNRNRTATLYVGDGQGGFTQASAGLAGVWRGTSAFGDFNGDSNPDLIITGDNEENVATTTLYENILEGIGNDAPVAKADSFSVPGGQTLTVSAPGVLDNDTDPNGDALTASLVSGVSSGSLTLDADGSFTYTPNSGFSGTDSFRYEADDGTASDTAMVSIFVGSSGGTPAFTRSGQDLNGVQDGGSTHWLDADGDGDQDLLVTGWDESFDQSATVYENDGTGAFTPMNAGLSGVRSGDADVGDIDGDGDVDLVITGEDSNFDPVATVYENDGQGNFTAVGAGLTGVEDGSATFGDFDQDGDPDLVITGRDQGRNATATIYENDGSGNFTAVGAGLTGVEASSTDWADVDGDSDLDLVVTGAASGGSGAGSGETPAGRERKCRGASAENGPRGWAETKQRRGEPRSLSQGSSDCVEQRQGSPTTTVYENQGDGAFAPLNAGLTGVETGAARFGDADGDGDPDLVVTGRAENSGRIATLYENDGTGGFTEHSAGLVPVRYSSVEWVDLRGDGDQDLIITGRGASIEHSATIYENDGTGSFTALGTGLTGVVAGSAAAADADGDGDVDVAVAGFDNLIGPSTRLYVNRRLQEDPNRSPRFAPEPESDARAAGIELLKPIEAGDPDGDPIELQLTSGAPNATFVNNDNGTGEFVFTPDRSQLGQTFNFTFEVTDGQGGSATSSFAVQVPEQFAALNAGLQGVNSSATAIGDVDNDGNQDLVITGRRGGGTTLYLGDGQGGFTSTDPGLVAVLDGSISTGDVNNDGNLDLLITGSGTEAFEPVTTLYLGDGQGGFTEANAGLANVKRSSSSIGDIDSDGNLDVLLAGQDANFNGVTTLYLGNGQGGFTEANAGLTDVGNPSTSIADVSADGAPDLLITGSGTATVYLGDGQGGFTEANAGLEGINGGSTSIADFDNDGNRDLLIAGSGTATVYLGDGQGGFADANAGLTGIGDGTTSVEDFDGDGNTDLLVAGNEAFRDPLTALYFGDGEGNFATANAGLVDARFGASSSTGNVDGDQDTDLLITGRRTPGNPTAILYENLMGGEQQCPLAWSIGMTGSDISGDSVSVTFGQSGAATAGIDPACGEEQQPPKPPSEVFDLRFTGTDLPGVELGEGLARDIRPTDMPTPKAAESAPATWRLEVQSSSFPVTFTWNNAALVDSLPGVPVRLVDVVTGGDLVDIDMKSTGSYTLENSNITALEIRLDRALSREVPIAGGWNLLSVPLEAGDPTFGTTLPLCESGFFFEPGTGYNEIADGEPVPVGRGLFADCSAGTAEVTGQAPDPTIEVAQGWNIIGPLADSVDVEAITSDPSGIVQTSFFGFDQTSGYQNTSTLAPGGGYWVKASESGTLDLSGSSNGEAALASKALATKAFASTQSASAAQEQPTAELRLTDAAGREVTLRLAKDISEEMLQRTSLPPVPPSGIFDVRFEGDRLVAEASGDALQTIETQGLKVPVTVRLANAEKGQNVQIQQSGETTRLTAERPSAELLSTAALAAGLQGAPDEFALEKSSPNPASGQATVKYALPEPTEVTISVYDVLGRRVATLADGSEEAGRHQVQFNADQMPSGTYFVRMWAEGFQQTRRLTVVR